MEVASSLRSHFDESTMERMPRDLLAHRLLVALEGDIVVGFLTHVEVRDGSTEITWMGVRPDHQRQGVGSALIERLEEGVALRGGTAIRVKTLADSVEYAPYEATRSFYRAMGFHLVGVIDPYPGWAPGNPCAIFEKPLMPGLPGTS